MRILLVSLALSLFPVGASADVVVEGVKLGASKADVGKIAGAQVAKDKVTLTPTETSRVDVSFDGKGRANKIYVTYRKGLFPIKDFTQQYGEPLKRDTGGNVKYVFTIKGEGTITLEKEKGYPGYYVEAVR